MKFYENYLEKINQKIEEKNKFFEFIRSKWVKIDFNWHYVIFSYSSKYFKEVFKKFEIIREKIIKKSKKFIENKLDEKEFKKFLLKYLNIEDTNYINSNIIDKFIEELSEKKEFKKRKREDDNISEQIQSIEFLNNYFCPANLWGSIEKKARWIAFDNFTKKIVLKSFTKFHNIHNWEISFWLIKEKLLNRLKNKINDTIYIKIDEKINWFLWLLWYDKYNDDFLFATKWTLERYNAEDNSEFITIFKELFNKHFDNIKNWNKLKKELLEFIKENNCTLIFEVVDVEKDPHIIAYDTWLYLLNILENKFKDKQLNIDLEDFRNKYWFLWFNEIKFNRFIKDKEDLNVFVNDFIEFLKDLNNKWKEKDWDFEITINDLNKHPWVFWGKILNDDETSEIWLKKGIKNMEGIVIYIYDKNWNIDMYKIKFWYYLFKKLLKNSQNIKLVKYKSLEEYLNDSKIEFDEDEVKILERLFKKQKELWRELTNKEILELI